MMVRLEDYPFEYSDKFCVDFNSMMVRLEARYQTKYFDGYIYFNSMMVRLEGRLWLRST